MHTPQEQRSTGKSSKGPDIDVSHSLVRNAVFTPGIGISQHEDPLHAPKKGDFLLQEAVSLEADFVEDSLPLSRKNHGLGLVKHKRTKELCIKEF